jgi:enolase
MLAQPKTAVWNGIDVSVPLPVRNTIQGGAHAVIKAEVKNRVMKYNMSDLSIQERHLIPNTYDMAENQKMCNTIQDIAMNLIFNAEGIKVMGTCNEGGIGAFFRSKGEFGAWEILMRAVEEAGYKPGEDVFFGFDSAADNFYKGQGVYEIDGQNFDSKRLMEYYEKMIMEFPILFTEDIFADEAVEHWASFTEKYGNRVFVCMDDIATTNARLVRPLIEKKVGNMLLLKMNQIGTLLEGWRAAEIAHKNGLMTISSHRSTSSIDFMEIEVALALSMIRENMGRCIFAKCGGAKLIERAMRYSIAQQWVEDWGSGIALSDPLPNDVKIKLFKAYAAPLNTGNITLGVRALLSNGFEITATVPAGTSTGETECYILPVEEAVKKVNDLSKELKLEGMKLGDLPSQFEFEQNLLSLELKEAMNKGLVNRSSTRLDMQIDMEMKRALGGNTILAMSVAFNRIRAAKEGKPSWLTLREAGLELNNKGLTFDDEAFYEGPIRTCLS